MQTTAENKRNSPNTSCSITTRLDRLFSRSWLYGVFALICIRPRALLDVDQLLASALHLTAFPLFEIATYAIFALVLLCYLLRWSAGAIRKFNPTLLCITGMFLFLALITFVFKGASGYHMDWHAGFALMLMIDMGLQRERKSLICALTGALEIWVYLNIISFIAFPHSFTPDESVKEWLLGNHVFYYRTVFPALALALVRYHLLGKRYKLRTVLLILACILTVLRQRGGTALVGAAAFGALLLWCSRRALPRYITPLVCVTFAAIAFIGIQYFDLLNLFAGLITKGLGKTMTLTKRTIIWDNMMAIVFNNPITGVGYFPVAYMSELNGWHVAHTHNQLLEILLHGGVIALALYLLAVFYASREALRYRRSPLVKTVTLLLCTFAVMGIAEIFHNDPIYYALFIFLSRSDCLVKDVKQLPRISVFTRIKRDLNKAKKA